MAKLIILVIAGMLLFLVACGGGTEDEDLRGVVTEASVTTQMESVVAEEPSVFKRAPTAPSFAAAEAGDGRVAPGLALQTVQRKVISSATVSIKVKVVEQVVAQVRTIAEGMGGFVEQLASSGSAERQQASMTIRVPQDRFLMALERIEALGEVESKNLGSEDVSEQFIDLEARLKSSLREEESLLALLGRSGTVSDVLTIERELARVRSEIERLQGQLNFLERRVALATITLSLFPPQVPVAQPPSGSLSLEVVDVTRSLEGATEEVEEHGGVVGPIVVSQKDGKETANLTIMVRSVDFDEVMVHLEVQGKVKSKEIRKGLVQVGSGGGRDQSAGGADLDQEPEALIELLLVLEDDSLNLALIVGIAAPIGGLALLAILGFMLRSVYLSGVRSRRYF